MRTLLTFLLLSTVALAQQPALPEKKGRIAGKVTDATTNAAV